ncbi:MAG TPA: protoporphyrinogen oxidase [Actinomycetota bacterium]|nr:protoporphyrinogen oxidase [Actinomycetota bacterium]
MSGRVAVAGAGIAGLTAAHRLTRRAPDLEVTVLESQAAPGGKIRSARVGGVMLEAGPDSLLARKPAGVELCRELGLGDDLVAPGAGVAQIWTDAGLLRFPSGPFGISTDLGELWRWEGMSRRGKLRAAGDLVRRARTDPSDESLGSLIRRRMGDEAAEKLVAPLLGGLFAGDVDRLSVLATFPELARWERERGSLIRGARAAARAARGPRVAPMFLRLRGGLIRLVEALGAELGPRLRCGVEVTGLSLEGDRYWVATSEGDLEADAVILATPAFVTADLVEPLAPAAAPELRAIPHVSTCVVLFVYEQGTGPALPESSGFVSPRGALAISAATLVSRKWPDRSFGDRAVIRCFVGGVGTEELVEAPDEDLVEGVCRQLQAIYRLPERAAAAAVVRWPRAMPQYEVGHLERVDRIERALPPRVALVGQGYRGTGIPDCIRGGDEAATRVASLLEVEGERVR